MTMPLRHAPPYDFQYRFKITGEFAGLTLAEFFTARFNFKTEGYWRDLIERGETTVNHEVLPCDHVLKKDDEVRTWRRDVVEPPVNGEIKVLYDKGGLFILDKKAPVPVHPSGRFFKNALTSILRETYPGRTFHTIHRLDLWTTGVLVLATDSAVAKSLHGQVKKRRMEKTYGVLAVGDFGTEPFTVDVAVGRKDGVTRGFGEGITEAKESVTKFTPLLTRPLPQNACCDGTDGEERHKKRVLTFLKAEPVTGRTNQIRVHIRAAGGHVLNDPMYSPHPDPEEKIPFLGLHCRSMAFILPEGTPFSATAPWPPGFLNHFSAEDLDLAFAD